MKKTIIITGANGMFGQDATQLFSSCECDVVALKRNDLDVTNLSAVREFFAKKNFDPASSAIIHAAAYTKVDDAEKEIDLAFLINAEGAKNVAIATKEKLLSMVYISTDYVFDGTKNTPHETFDKTNPLNVYGKSKLLGEENVRQNNPNSYIARTSWLYGKYGKNFVDTMISLSQKQSVLKVVDDQFGCPTWTHDLAYGIKNLIEQKKPFGTYHICGAGVTSWYGFAKKIFEIRGIDVELIPVTTEEFPRPAVRPKFSAMNNGGICRSWEEALKEYLRM